MKKILILQAHPNKDSFVNALTQAYYNGAKEHGFDVKLVHLVDLEFDLILRNGYKKEQDLEPDLLMIQDEIKKADHLVISFPMWWGTMPALLKGFFDRTFIPGFAFQYTDKFPMKLLKGKSARFIMTMDSPSFYYRLFVGAPVFKLMKKAILGFSGFAPISKTVFYSVRTSTSEKRTKWVEQIGAFGRKGQ